jgi:hypothetical protein
MRQLNKSLSSLNQIKLSKLIQGLFFKIYLMEWVLKPVRPKIALYYGSACLYFWALAREPLNPAKKQDPDFIADCYYDQLRGRISKKTGT